MAWRLGHDGKQLSPFRHHPASLLDWDPCIFEGCSKFLLFFWGVIPCKPPFRLFLRVSHYNGRD